jgi:hypothetical protein
MSIADNPYFQNVASDFITLSILVITGAIAFRFSRRRNLLRFFGCAKNRNIRLYLSNLDIVYGGAIDPSGLPRGYRGASTPGYELPFGPALYRLFVAPVPELSSQRGWWRYLAVQDIEVAISPAPNSALDIDRSATLITVGSLGYNTVSAEVERSFTPCVRLDPDGWVVSPDGVRHSGTDYALLAKCYNPERRQWAFYTAGSTRVGTTSAFSYLLQNWPKLRKEFGDESSFSVTIRVIDGDPSRCEVVHQYREAPKGGSQA